MDKFESMRAFVAVVEAGGFAAAARGMELSRSTVNKLVHNLEDQLGVQLLHRSTRQVNPTEAGLAYYDRCVAILADLQEADLAMTQLHRSPQGILRLNAPMSFGTLHLSAMVIAFMQRYPQVQVQLTLEDRLVDPIAEGYDFVVRIAQPPDSAALIVQRLVPAHRVLCAAPSYLASRGAPKQPADLHQHSCLHYGLLATGNQWRFTGPDGDQAVTIQGVLCSNNAEVLQDAALEGLGIALLPTFMVGPDLQSGRLVTVLDPYQPPEIWVCAVYPVNRQLSTKVQLFLEFLTEQLGVGWPRQSQYRPAWDRPTRPDSD